MKKQYVIGVHGYKVNFSGFAYVEADTEEEANEKFDDEDFVYKEVTPGPIEKVEEMVIDL